MSGFKKFCVASLMLLMAVCLTAQSGLKLMQANAANFPRVELNMRMTGADAGKVDLGKAKFSIDLDNSFMADSIRVLAADKAAGSRVLICIDASGSVTAVQMTAIREALKMAVESKATGTQMAIALFANEFDILQDFTEDGTKLLSAIAAIKNKPGNTYLHFNLNKAINHVRQAGGQGTRAVVLISDGKEEVKFDVVTNKDKEDMIATANRFGIPIHCIGYANDKAPDYTILDYFAEKTGGSFVPVKQKSDLPEGLHSMLGIGKGMYRLSFVITGIKGDGKSRTLNVSARVDDKEYSDSKSIQIPANGRMYAAKTGSAGLWQRYRWFIVAALALLIALIFYLFSRRRKASDAAVEEIAAPEEALAPAMPDGIPEIASVEAVHPPKPEPQGEVRYQGRSDRTMILGPGTTLIPEPEEVPAEELAPEPEPAFVGFTLLKIEIMDGPDQGQIFTVQQRDASIGRSPDNSIVLSDGQCSRRHAVIEYREHQFSIRDLDSGNGTYINGVRVTSRQIEHNDSFRIGGNSGVFTLA